MTGFGEAATQHDGVHYAVELRSLNNRYFKATIRLPEEIQGLEAELETQLRRRINRGSITLVVKLRLGEAQGAHHVNDAALLSYLDHLATLHERVAERDHKVHIDLTALLALPGVLQPLENEQSMMSRSRDVIRQLVDEACVKLTAMRQTEGEAIAADLRTHSDAIRSRVGLIQGRTGEVVEAYHERLKTRVNELIARAEMQVGENDLVRELAVYAERSDISEELSRLAGHLDQF